MSTHLALSISGPVAVALSGGVDSAVAAARLVAGGCEVVGLTARFVAGGASSSADRAVERAAELCTRLRIPHQVCDLTAEFAREVVQPFLEGYSAGLTPNPCLRCNPRVKFGALLAVARDLGCSHLATGHYALRGRRQGRLGLRRAEDATKDQSYMLMGLSAGQVAAALFPLGRSRKSEVVAEAQRLNLPHLEQQSQDVCFVAGSARDYLERHLPMEPGPIVDLSGKRLGTHRGLALYTVGQRRGLAIGGMKARLHVVSKLPETNTLLVGPKEFLCRVDFTTTHTNWVSVAPPRAGERLVCRVMVRYRGKLMAGAVTVLGPGQCRVEVEPHNQAIAPGQGAAFYDEEGWLLGGGMISPGPP